MNLNYKFKNQGLTLIEALIWFAIFGAVVAGVFTLYSSSRNASNASIVNKELSTIFSQTEQLYAYERTQGLTNAVALQLGIVPQSLKVNGDIINNIFGGTVTIVGVSPSAFKVSYSHIPSGEVCANIVKSQKAVGWNSANSSGLKTLYDATYLISSVTITCGSNGEPARSVVFERANVTGV